MWFRQNYADEIDLPDAYTKTVTARRGFYAIKKQPRENEAVVLLFVLEIAVKDGSDL